MTPFKKKFPQAEKGTVFVAAENQSSLIAKGEKLKLNSDDGSIHPYFDNISNGAERCCANIEDIELADQTQFAFGEEVQVRVRNSDDWENRWFAYDSHDLKGVIELDKYALIDRYVTVNNNGDKFSWSQIRKLPQTQTVKLENGEVITVSGEFVQEIRDNAIDGS